MLIQYDLGTSGPIKKSLFHFAGGLPKTLHYIAMQSVHMYFQMILDRLQLGISHPWTKSLVSPKRALSLSQTQIHILNLYDAKVVSLLKIDKWQKG